jgi:UDP:flavonoid glycosyltransferase YjiC (YdhE family)
MNVLLLTIGSHGDVHPFVGLGAELRRRGHDVTLITNGHFEPMARAADLGFVELGTDEQYQQIIKDPNLWHKLRAFKTVFGKGVAPLMEPSYRAVESNYLPGRTVVVASSLAYGARIAQDKLGIPTASVHLQPGVMRTAYDAPKLPGLPMPRWTPPALKRLTWLALDKFVADPVMAPAVNELRATLGLAPVSRLLSGWWHSPARVIGMWPEWFGPPQPDWPRQMRLVGFPLYDERDVRGMSRDLAEWLDAGDPPVAFTAGSAMVHAREFFAASVDACVRLKRRGLLLTRFAEQLPRDIPPSIKHVDYAPFGPLLPRCAAVVHHGGIGTTAQSLRAGVPQLVMPMAHDQFDNAARVRRLGVGLSIGRRGYRTANVTRVVHELVDSPDYSIKARKVATRFVGVEALAHAADLVEDLIRAPKAQIVNPSAISNR